MVLTVTNVIVALGVSSGDANVIAIVVTVILPLLLPRLLSLLSISLSLMMLFIVAIGMSNVGGIAVLILVAANIVDAAFNCGLAVLSEFSCSRV